MPTKEFCELKVSHDAPADATAFLVIETAAHRVFLYRYNAQGHLLSNSVHDSVDDARRAVQQEYSTLAGEWRHFSDEVPSIAALCRGRVRERYETKPKDAAHTLTYAGPAASKAAWWRRGLAAEILSCSLLLLSFGLIYLPPDFVAVFLWHDLIRRGAWDLMTKTGEFGMVCTIASPLVWRFRAYQVLFGFLGIVGLAIFVCGLVIGSFFMSGIVGLIVLAMSGPCLLLLRWRFEVILHRPPK